MPFVSPEIRLQLNLVGSCPSDEDIATAAAAQGLHWTGTQLIQPAARKPAKAAAKAASPGDGAGPTPADA